jgi:hypothetical protein
MQTLSIIQIILQIVVALGIYNVWFIRPKMATAYRGKGAATLREEFLAYGLPSWAIYVIGTVKVGAATALLVGLWYGPIVIPAATVMAVLMAGALSMHVRVHDPIKRSVPALAMFVMAVAIIVIGFVGLSGAQNTQATPDTDGVVACTMDAKIRPDGSAVGRTGPDCEFAACPGGAL